MSFFSLFIPKPSVKRRLLTGAVVRSLVTMALQGRVSSNFRAFLQKDWMAVTTRADLAAVANKAWIPWRRAQWECEDQARAVIDAAQRKGANEGCSWACGTLRSEMTAPEGMLHVYIWALVEHPGSTRTNPQSEVAFFDPTALKWVEASALRNVDYLLT